MIAVTIANILKEKSDIAVISHVMPDGDSVGSMLTLFNVLGRLNKDVDIYSSDKIPDVYSFLPGFHEIKYCDEMSTNKTYEVLVVLDCGSMDRTGKCEKLYNNSSVTINIDHHLTNSLFADLNLVDTNAAAAGELIYQIIKLMGIEILKEEALCLYTAIMTDTGGFRYSNTTSVTHQIAGDLINTGIDFNGVYDKVYRSYKYEDIKVMGKAISSIELHGKDRIAYMQLLTRDMEGLSLESINTSDFIDYARDINSVEVAIFVKEIAPKEYKVSLRSKRLADVKSICEKYGGGGHLRAAGCTIRGDLSIVKEQLISEVQSILKDDNM